ncbi:hypothetical protein PENSPDRAFT_153402 [Peniophora sp. CONT]|nr:hypothetical protein PENSPDRAFT_153402 [Peniophora sp. CONT]
MTPTMLYPMTSSTFFSSPPPLGVFLHTHPPYRSALQRASRLPPRFYRTLLRRHRCPHIPIPHPRSRPRPLSLSPLTRFCATFLNSLSLLPAACTTPIRRSATMPAYPLTAIPHPAPSRAHGRCGPCSSVLFRTSFDAFLI